MVFRLPEPEDLTSLLVRTDFTDDAAFAAILAAATEPSEEGFVARFTVLADVALDGVGPQDLIRLSNIDLRDFADPADQQGGVFRGF
jgi:hypothetical protein